LQLRAADVDAPARISFTAELASSFEQAAHSLGVGAQFSLGLVNAGLGVSFGGSHSLSFRTIVVKLTQPMYTVSVADDKITHTADFFAEDVGIDDLEGIEAQGLIGRDNQPTFIKSVTYGRVLYYSISTEDAADNEEVAAAVNASYRGFGGNVDTKNSYDRIMSRAIVEVLALGGSQDDALAAIRSGDFSLFFKPVKVAQAIPISYKLNYMQGDRGVVAIRSALDYTVRDCTVCSPAKKTESRVVYSKPYDEAGGLFGQSINDLFAGACSAGWSQGQVERPVFGGGGTCDARFASTDPNDCRVLVHIGIPAFQGVKCQIDARETREIPGQPPLCPPPAP
jgi:hypothetical protein